MFNYKHLAVAIASIGAVSVASAAGLDRSGQDVTAFLQDGTYGEVVYTYIDADVSGKDISGNPTSDIAQAYDFGRFGVKADINDTFSVGVLYDEPWGAAVEYQGNSNFVADKNTTATIFAQAINQGTKAQLNDSFTYRRAIKPVLDSVKSPERARAVASILESNSNSAQTKLITDRLRAAAAHAEATDGQGTNVEIRTQNATLLLGAKLGENKNLQIYGGPQMQRLTGEVHLRGAVYGPMTGYDANIGADMGYGWVAGVAYHKPEIALKAALTYRSKIDHERSIAETIPVTGYQNSQNFKATLPNSWNLDFQTGINPTTLLSAKVRYVPWSDFAIRPPQYGTVTATGNNNKPLPIVNYSKDQWSAELGLGRKVSDKLAVSGSVGYDSGAGNPISTLGPIKGYYSLGLGAKYNVTPEWSVSLGGKYFKFGDATAQLPNGTKVGEFDGNDGYVVGLKLAYQRR